MQRFWKLAKCSNGLRVLFSKVTKSSFRHVFIHGPGIRILITLSSFTDLRNRSPHDLNVFAEGLAGKLQTESVLLHCCLNSLWVSLQFAAGVFQCEATVSGCRNGNVAVCTQLLAGVLQRAAVVVHSLKHEVCICTQFLAHVACCRVLVVSYCGLRDFPIYLPLLLRKFKRTSVCTHGG